MGAFAPVPGIDPALVDELVDTFLVKASRGMAAEGNPYVGVIYAGIMLTANGPRLVEYNCRFGDPETQVLMPLLDGDLLEVMAAAANGDSWTPLRVRPDTTAVTVVVAAAGYPADPTKGIEIPADLEFDQSGVHVLHAGTTREPDGRLVSSGGRVLNVVGLGADLEQALRKAYPVVNDLTANSELFARSDIGWRYATVESGSVGR